MLGIPICAGAKTGPSVCEATCFCSRDHVLENVTDGIHDGYYCNATIIDGIFTGWRFLVVLLLTCSHTFIHPILNNAKILSTESETIKKKKKLTKISIYSQLDFFICDFCGGIHSLENKTASNSKLTLEIY